MPSTVVPNGAVSVTITGAFGTAAFYEFFAQAVAAAGWATTISVTKSTDSVLVEFGTPAPASATLDWFVVGATPAPPSSGAVTLSTYLAEVRRLLRARTGDQLYNDDDLTAFINRAMQQRDLDLGLNRSLVSFPMVTGQFQYPIASILAGGTILAGSANPNVIDVLSILITPLGQAPGGIRYPLGRWPYSKLAYLLSTSYPTYPVKYAMFGTQTIMVGPPPAGNYSAYWDFFGYASPLVSPLDADPQGYPWTDPVPFLAAHFAKVQTQRFDEAQQFLGLYDQRLNRVRARGRPISVANPLSDLPPRWR